MSEPNLLIAGIGNLFFRDDGFDVAVARPLAAVPRPAGVRVVDFGIRGFDLALALLDGNDGTILIDAHSRGGPPGTLYVIEPDLAEAETGADLSPHAMHPAAVLRTVQMMGGRLGWLRVVGCEPAELGSEEEPSMELSPAVQAAVEPAAQMVRDLIQARRAELAVL